MKFEFEIPDECLLSLDMHLQAQVRTEQDPLTRATRIIRNPGFEDIESFLAKMLSDALDQVCDMYPTGERRVMMEKAESLKKQAKESSLVLTVAQRAARIKAKG